MSRHPEFVDIELMLIELQYAIADCCDQHMPGMAPIAPESLLNIRDGLGVAVRTVERAIAMSIFQAQPAQTRAGLDS